ncbi:MAG: hypothetical protein K2X27_15775 [Candidatus Obscuribacterales bacterium]|nr:hypothetical protein [Candidatus Obscuribacterales bacterium]
MAKEKDKKGENAKPAGSKKPKSSNKVKIDLEKLKNTYASQAPRSSSDSASTAAGGIPGRSLNERGPEMNWKFSIISAVSVLMLALTTHLFSINNGLVLNDRYNLAYLMSKPQMERVSQKILSDMLGLAPLGQPWLKSSFIADHGEYALNFMWYHVVNVYWHALSSALLFFVLLTMGRHLHHQGRMRVNPYHLALAAAALFAVHPLSCESVSYLSARSSLLGLNNFLLSLSLFLLSALSNHKLLKASFALLTLWTGLMSIWSNPECITLPFLAALSLLLVKNPIAKWKETFKEHPYALSTALALSIGVPALCFLGVEHTSAINLFLPTPELPAYIAGNIKGFVFYYLRCFFIPLGLSIDPPLIAAAKGFSDPLALLALAIVAALIFLSSRIKEGILGFAAVLLIAGFLPHACMRQTDVVADWVAYLPLSAAMIFAAYGLCKLAEKNLRNASLVFVSLTLGLSGLSLYRNFQWGSNTRLWESALALRPKSGLAHAMLALEQLKVQNLDAAEKELKLASSYNPELVIARIAQAKLALARKQFSQADQILAAALNLADSQKLAPVVKNECRFVQLESLIAQHKAKEGNEILSRLLQDSPGEAKLIYLVALSALENKDYERAFSLLSKSLSLDPSLSEAWLPLTESALALRYFEQAYQIASTNLSSLDDANARILLARAALVYKHESEAEEILKNLVRRDPRNAKAAYLLSRLYKRIGKTEEWKKYRDDALKLEPAIVIKFPLPELETLDTLEQITETKASNGVRLEAPAGGAK